MSRLGLEFGRRVMSNGGVLLAARNTAADTFAVACSLEVDQRMEPGAKAGVANLTGACLDEGTKKHSGEELAEIIEGFGGSIDASGSGAAIAAPLAQFKKAVPLLAEVVTTPSFPDKAIRREREIALSDIKSDMEEPRTVAFLKFKQLVYGAHPYARPTKGTLATVKGLVRADSVKFHGSWFAPARAVIAGSGNLPVERMLDQLEHSFRSWRNEPLPLPAVPAPARPRGVVRDRIEMEREQVHLYLGHPGIARSHPDFYRLLVMDHVLGTGPGFTDRISKKLRDEMGLCYTVSASIAGSAGREPGYFACYIGASPEQEERALEALLAEIRAIRKVPPSDEEIKTVRDYLSGSFVLGLERNSSLAAFLIRSERFELGFDYIERFPEIVRSVTPEEARAAAEKHIDPDNYVLVSAGPRAKQKPSEKTKTADAHRGKKAVSGRSA